MAELKPCPFCGGEAFHYFFFDGFYDFGRVVCKKCNVELTAINCIGTEAIEAWNRRVEDGK